jgi:hypothetical protein
LAVVGFGVVVSVCRYKLGHNLLVVEQIVNILVAFLVVRHRLLLHFDVLGDFGLLLRLRGLLWGCGRHIR